MMHLHDKNFDDDEGDILAGVFLMANDGQGEQAYTVFYSHGKWVFKRQDNGVSGLDRLGFFFFSRHFFFFFGERSGVFVLALPV